MEAIWGNNKIPPITNNFYFGIVSTCTSNRPTGGANYANSVPWREQLDMIQAIGGNAVRIAVNTTNSGSADKPGFALYDTMLKEFLAEIINRDMMCVICLIDQATQFMGNTWDHRYDIDLDQTEQELEDQLPDIEQSAFDTASGFLTIYGPYLNTTNFILELGNEPELFRSIIKEGGLNGGDVSHYWPKKLLLYRTYYRGFYNGAMSVMPDLKKSTPASSGFTMAYLYAQLLLESPDIDYISWHWYDEMERIMTRGQWPSGAGGNPGSSYRSIFDWLWDRYGKRIIITECNARGIGYNGEAEDYTEADAKHQDRQIAFFGSFLSKARLSPYVDVITAYKLLSEPYQNTMNETSYGLNYYTGKNLSLPAADQDWSNYIPKKSMKLLQWNLK